jgi:hypothetical protein
MSAIGNGQQSMSVTNLKLKIKKMNHKTLYALYLYIHALREKLALVTGNAPVTDQVLQISQER